MTSTVIQADIDQVLIVLKELRQQLTTVWEALEPLEVSLNQTYEEFQDAVGGPRRQSMRLQSEIANLRAQIDSFEQDQIEYTEPPVVQDNSLNDSSEPTEDTPLDPEAVEKDILLEHLFRVLDPMTNEEDSELLANFQGLCQDPNVSLADILDELPWGPVWTQRSRQEALVDQHQRLTSWKKALEQQLEILNQSTERLKKDSRYGLWQQRQKGTESWQMFLTQYAEQLADQNAELETELENLRQEWARLTEIKGV